jgi:FKBP-type peptidyl-prolyl cis-trans isomerase 2
VPAAQIPSTAKLGNTLSMRTTKGVSMGRLIAIDGDDAYLDLNHFLVNQDLNFDLSLVKALKPKN